MSSFYFPFKIFNTLLTNIFFTSLDVNINRLKLKYYYDLYA